MLEWTMKLSLDRTVTRSTRQQANGSMKLQLLQSNRSDSCEGLIDASFRKRRYR